LLVLYFRRRANQSPIIVDPFAGSGTTFLESSKFGGFRCFASDLSHASKLLCTDNARFFSLRVDELDDLLRRLEAVNDYVKRGARNLEDPQLWLGFDRKDDVNGPVYDWAFDLVSSVPDRDEHPGPEIVNKLKEEDFFARLIFYIAIRTRMRNIAAFEREARDWRSAFLKESTVLLEEIKKLRTLRQSRLCPVKCGNPQLFAFQSRYSIGVSFQSDFEAQLRVRGVLREAHDATEKAGYPKNVDLIVTDPPYGFNTDVEAIDLAEVWALSLEAMISALANNGQLVICLPDHSHTGRTLQHFTLKEFVTNQVISIARSLKREAVTAGEIVPAPGCLFRPPYRWEAARALRRSILHFRFRSMM